MNYQELKQAAYNFALTCGILGLIGCLVALAGSIIGIIVVDGHNPISETISTLAIGKYAWIQDVSLDFFAVAAIACGAGLYAWNLGGRRWKIGALALVVLGIDVILIAEHNQYAGRPGYGAAIHIHLVRAFGVLFALSTLLLAFGLRRIDQNWYRFSMGTAIGWALLAPLFFLVPTAWDGAYERFLGLLVFTWTIVISRLLVKRGVGRVTVRSAHTPPGPVDGVQA